jgi:vitamin B12 transporter
MTFRLITLLALTTATPAIAQSIVAQASDDTAKGDDIVVTATRSGDAIPIDLIGSSVTVIDSQDLQDRQTRILSDVLRDVPGVEVNRTGGVGGLTSVRIRGSENNHVLVFVDGIKVDDPYSTSGFDFSTLLNDEASRVEVLRGQQSSLYGSDAIGGVISYTTLSGREAPGITLRAEGGSMGTYSLGGRAAGVVNDTLDYAFSTSYYHTDGYRVAENGTRDLGDTSLGTTGKINWTPASNFKLTAVGRYSYTDADITDFGFSADPPVIDGYAVNTAIDLAGYHQITRGWYGLIGATWSLFDDAWTNSANMTIADTNTKGLIGDTLSFGDHGRRYRASFDSTVRFGTDRVKNRFTMAVDAQREDFANTTPQDPAFPFDRSTHRLDTLGFVTEYDVTVDDRLSLGASARIDDYNLFQGDATYRATASYLFDTGTHIHAAYGTGVKTPTSGDLFGFSDGRYQGNPNLKPEKSKGWEAGVEQSFFGKKAKIGATYFHSRLLNEIDVAGTEDAEGNFVQTAFNNPVRSLQRGVETYLEVGLGEWRLNASYTYLHAPQTLEALAQSSQAGGGLDQLPVPVVAQAVRRAKNIASVDVTYAPRALPLTTTVTVRYNGRQRDYAFNAFFNRVLLDEKAFTLVNLNVGYDLNPHVQIFGRVENLLDKNYQEVFSYRTPGRAAYGGVRLKI